jgi:hypothetical protein
VAGTEQGARPVVTSVCVHIDGSAYRCPGTTKVAGDTTRPAPGDTLFSSRDSITIAPIDITLKSGKKVTLLVPEHVDAIFFTKEGAKILLDHYRAHQTDKDLRNAYKARGDSLETYLKAIPPQ